MNKILFSNCKQSFLNQLKLHNLEKKIIIHFQGWILTSDIRYFI